MNNFTFLFVYGTLVDPEVRKDLLGRSHDYLSKDRAIGFRVENLTIENLTYPAMVPDSTRNVEGYVTTIHEDELRILDEYETPAYSRSQIVLESGTQAWTYLKKS